MRPAHAGMSTALPWEKGVAHGGCSSSRESSRNLQEEILPEQIIWTKLYKSISMIRKARLVWLKRPPPRQKLQNEKRPKRKHRWNLGMELEGICHLMIRILDELLLGKSFLLEHLRKDPRHLRKPLRKHRKNTVNWYFIYIVIRSLQKLYKFILN